ncbi:MAG: hypothetical protein AAB606_03335, partial [Patescibacteria group bacterium]
SQAKEICGGLTAGDKEKTTLIAVNQDQCQKDGQDICRVVAWAEDVAGNLNYDPQSAEHERKPRTMNFDRTDPVVFVASPLDGAWVNGRSGGSGGSQKIDVAVFDSRSNDCAINAAENVSDLYAKISAFKSMAAFNWSGYTNFLGLIPTSKQDVRNLIRDFHEAFTDPLGKLKNAVLNIDFVNHCGVFIGDAANCQFQANSSIPVKFSCPAVFSIDKAVASPEIYIGPGSNQCGEEGAGKCSVKITATDDVGNSADETVSLNVDWTSPTSSFVSPSANSLQLQPHFRVDAKDTDLPVNGAGVEDCYYNVYTYNPKTKAWALKGDVNKDRLCDSYFNILIPEQCDIVSRDWNND